LIKESKMAQSNDSTKNPNGERKALGRGLAALFNDVQSPASPYAGASAATGGLISRTSERAGPARTLPLAEIEPNPDQPRKHFNDVRLSELAESIREQGLVQPIVVRKVAEQKYVIVAGERRWRASKLAGLKEIPVYVRDLSHTETDNDLASLVENIQREELNPLELAEAYSRLLDKKTLTQESLSKKLGVSRVAIANTLRLLKLPDSVRPFVVEGKIKEGHARALLSLPTEELMTELANQIVEAGLSVRDVEARTKEILNPPTQEIKAQLGNLAGSHASSLANTAASEEKKSPELLALEEELRQTFGTKVNIKGNGARGIVEVYYSGSDSLNRLIHLLRASKS
jgi:ParB family transcriptional regulator, chromosome partitioning protein